MYMRYLLSISLLFLAAALSAGEAAAMRAGNRAYDKERYGEAFDIYEKAARQGGGQEAVYNTGAALYRLKDYEGAQAAYESVEGNLRQDALFNAGDAAYMKGDLDTAAQKFRQAILMNLKDNAAVHNLQFVLQQKDNNKQEQEQKEGENQDKDNSEQNSGNQQNSQQQEQKLSKEEADNILQQVSEQKNPPPKAPKQQNGAEAAGKVEKDW